MARPTGNQRLVACAVAVLAAAPLGATGCRDSGPDTVSGSRLVHHGWVSGDASAYRRTLDTELGVPCSMATADDGATRCLPEGQVFPTEWFTDDRCSSEGVVVGSTDGTYGPLGRLPDDSGSCESRFSVVELTPVEDGDTVYIEEDGDCVPASSTAVGFALAVRRPASDFVEVSRESRRASGDVGVEVWVGDDGSRLLAGSWDERFGSAAVMELTAPAGERLVPSISASPMSYHSNATCDAPVYGAEVCDPDSVGVLLEWVSNSDPPRALRVGDQVPSTSLFTTANEDSGCMPETWDGLERYVFFSPGDVFGPDDLAEVSVEIQGEGPVQTRAWVTAEGTVVGVADPPLAAGGQPCTPVPLSTLGQAACVPGVPHEVNLGMGVFADAECAARPLISQGEENADLGEGEAVVERLERVDGVDVFTVWVVQGAHSGPVYSSGPEGCVAEEGMWDGEEPFWVLSAAESGVFVVLDDQAL